ncbi:MAG: tetratricopeptide repeat protein [Parcubacteria group bacterium]|nr:tetratricopeptide repeat protein [Parcubacteria group bacterium]
MIKKKLNSLSKVLIQNFWAVGFLVIVSLILIFVAKQDTLAKLLWQKYRLPKTALLLVNRDTDLAMFIGNYYFNGVIGGGKYDLNIAEKAYKKAVLINPKILWGHYQLARIYFVKGDYKQALEEIAKELEANPENLRSLYVRGLIYGYRNQAGDLEKAEADFLRFTLWAPKEWAGYNDLAWILSKQGKYKEAKEAINAAFREIKESENNPWLWNALGVAELNLKEYKNAAISFEKAKQLAEKLTNEDWFHSYPGNNPVSAEEGLSAFIAAIEKNLRRASQ